MAAAVSLKKVHDLANRALVSGASRPRLLAVEWDIAPRCHEPVDRVVFGRRSLGPGTAVFTVYMTVRCRKCDPCRAARAATWRLRASAETQAAVRTWFGTLTLKPELQFWALTCARRKETLQGVDFDALPYGEQFTLRHHVITKEITKYLKRIRKGSGAPLRYLLVCEAHKSGLPHYHMLVHETNPLMQVAWDILDREWFLGHSQWKLVTDKAQSTYLCKYLGKSLKARVRASQFYGQTTSVIG